MTTVRSNDHVGGVRLLTLDRPPANAINQELMRDLEAALDDAREDDRVRAVVLAGEGRFFSGGFDCIPRRIPAACWKSRRPDSACIATRT